MPHLQVNDFPCFLAENSILKKRNLAAKSPFLDVRETRKRTLNNFFAGFFIKPYLMIHLLFSDQVSFIKKLKIKGRN